MSNILNHNRDIIDINLNKDDYWDFSLYLEQGYADYCNDNLTERCLCSYIDFNDPNCVWFDSLHSKENYVWENAYNKGVVLDSIGYTGVDNGTVFYEKDKTSNKKFLDMFFNSSLSLEKDDVRLSLHKVNGNNQIYSYDNNIVIEDGMQVAKLEGGFYQGFFHTKDNEYSVFPTSIGDGWGIEVVLKKSDMEVGEDTLNYAHPNNKGMFFYIGTRAENKWWKYYMTDENFGVSCRRYNIDGYVKEEYVNQSNEVSYMKPIADTYNEDGYFDDEYIVKDESAKSENKECIDVRGSSYFKDNYIKKEFNQKCDNCLYYVNDEYLENDVVVDDSIEIKTSEGYDVRQPNITEFKTDNKFLLFDRTKNGHTVNDWSEDEEVILYDIKTPEIENYFTLFNRTKSGYTTDNISNLINKENKRYIVLNDIYRNALGFQITDKGEVGYKYLVKDCDNDTYKIENEFSDENVVTNDKWASIFIKIVPISNKENSSVQCETQHSVYEEMQIFIYVNGKLKLISKKLPILNLKKLNDLYSKQEGVPFNISLGGGTQGLCDVVYPDFRNLPEYVLPLEENFAGSFLGYLKTFKFYNCNLNIQEISANYEFEIKLLENK